MKKISFLLLIMLAFACDPCRDVSCVNGTCDQGTCVCETGWTGSNCETNLCSGINCNHGTCTEGICTCESNYTGTYCEEAIEPCLNVECGDNGTCVEGNCDCTEGWSGNYCNIFSGEEPPDAALSIWTSMTTFPCNTQQIDVYLGPDSTQLTFQGSLTNYLKEPPTQCDAAGTVTIEVVHGTFYLYAECFDGDAAWAGPVSIEKDICSLIELTPATGKSLSLKALPLKLLGRTNP